ncbi:MAG TPA: hypothetical protein PKN99_03015 [Cyclobacteriaceae bacterium]|jgi:hypothetical protein|nr:hypothetical protein [Cyclobacteriaceae bacterium]
MKGIINFNNAVCITLVLAALLIVFHLCVIMGILLFDFAPVDYLWGGRMETSAQLLTFELISLLISVLFLVLVLIKANRITLPALKGVAHLAMWLFFILFLFNTVGNLIAKTTFEKFFALVTGLLAFLLWRIVIEKKSEKES